MSEQEIKQLVRLCGADIQGTRKLKSALRKIKGVSYSFSNAICIIADLDETQVIGALTDKDIKKIEDILAAPEKHGLPSWMLNRRKDFDTGKDTHLISTDLKFRKDFDIKQLKKIKCYRGVRHSVGLPVRGQRTQSNFRKAGKSVGVKKKSGKKGKV